MPDQPPLHATRPGPTRVPVTIPGVHGDLAGVLVTAPGAERPGVVVLPEIDGFCDDTILAATRLADAGYMALALDLYAPLGGTPPLRGIEATLAWSEQLNDFRQLSDLAAGLDWLTRQPGVAGTPVGLVGFSLGGRYAMLLGTEPRDVGAVVTFYTRPWPSEALGGIVISPGEHIAKVRPPLCAVFGADDELIPTEMVDRFTAAAAPRPDNEVHVVPGRHLFTNPSRVRRYRSDSAERAWAAAIAFLDRHIGGADGETGTGLRSAAGGA